MTPRTMSANQEAGARMYARNAGLLAELDAERALTAELVAALADVMAGLAGQPKSCGHDFHCACGCDAAWAVLAKARGQQGGAA